MKLPHKDKLLHALAGIYIFLFARLLFSDEIAISIVLLIAVAKELIWDKLLKKGTPEIADAAYTFVGGASVLVFLKLIF
jgi:hypothetical protein